MTAENSTAALFAHPRLVPSAILALLILGGANLASSPPPSYAEEEAPDDENEALRSSLRMWSETSYAKLVEPDATATTSVSEVVSWPIEVNPLYEVLQKLRSTDFYWDDEYGDRPSEATLRATEKVLAFIPSSMSAPKIGFGGERDLYFSWENEKGVAFLTIDEHELHLLIKPVGKPSIYRDNLPHDQKILSNQILPALQPFATLARTVADI